MDLGTGDGRAILIAAAAYLLQPKQDSPEHSTNSDAVNGASAALLYAQAMGHPADQITGSFAPPPPYSMMFVFTPTSPYTAEEAANTADPLLSSIDDRAARETLLARRAAGTPPIYRFDLVMQGEGETVFLDI